MTASAAESASILDALAASELAFSQLSSACSEIAATAAAPSHSIAESAALVDALTEVSFADQRAGFETLLG